MNGHEGRLCAILTGLWDSLKTKNVAPILARLNTKSPNWLDSKMENGSSGNRFNNFSVFLVDALVEALRWASSDCPDLASVRC